MANAVAAKPLAMALGPPSKGTASSPLKAILAALACAAALRGLQLGAQRLRWPARGAPGAPAREERRPGDIGMPGGRHLLDLNVTCDSTLYPSLFFNNTCSPAFCSVAKDYSTPTCIVSSTSYNFAEKVAQVASKQCRSCTQAADSRCSTAFLNAAFAGREGVYAAYCNDNYLVIHSDGNTGSIPNLNDVPTPPGGTMNGALCRTRMATYVGASPRVSVSKYKLCPALLPTAAGTNNIETFADGAADSPNGYLSSTGLGVVYGLPSGGAVGTTVAGQQIYPTFNNRASYTPENCEVDHCNQHVGQGGGYPHTHGDSFGPNCLYSAANYTDATAHPPLTGFSFDGFFIYGRYLYSTSSGYSTALDDCGGHSHSDFDGGRYHYHNQVLNLTTTGFGAMGVTAGQHYIATTVGPHKCWRANISADAGFWAAGPSADTYITPCCGSTHWYVRPGVSISGVGTQATGSLTGSICASYNTTTTTTTTTTATTTASTPTPTPTPSPSPLVMLGVTLKPAANASVLASSGAGVKLRRAIANATGLPMAQVIIASIVGPSGTETLESTAAVNTASRRLQTAVTGSTVNTVLSVDSTNATAIAAVAAVASEIAAGTNAIAATGFAAAAASWAATLGTTVQTVSVTTTTLTTTNNAGSSSGLSAGAIAGIVIGSVAGVVLIGVAVYYLTTAKPKRAAVASVHSEDALAKGAAAGNDAALTSYAHPARAGGNLPGQPQAGAV